jgi:2-dehydro-3-deoxygluconokinase
MTKLICIGECMLELRDRGANTYTRAFAGDTYNTAVYFKRSAPEAEVQFVTATGDDSVSRAMREGWRSEGVSDALAFTVPATLPGIYLIELDEAGERQFLYWRSASAARQWMRYLIERGGAEALAGADCIYLSGISLAILSESDRLAALAMLQTLKAQGKFIAFCVNVRGALWPDIASARRDIEAAAESSSIVFASVEDAARLYDRKMPRALMTQLRHSGAPELILTRGSEGCMVAEGGEIAKVPAPRARVVDTSGAGDAFNGAYLAHRLAGEPPTRAARFAIEIAARVVTANGALVPRSVSHPA